MFTMPYLTPLEYAVEHCRVLLHGSSEYGVLHQLAGVRQCLHLLVVVEVGEDGQDQTLVLRLNRTRQTLANRRVDIGSGRRKKKCQRMPKSWRPGRISNTGRVARPRLL